MIRNLAGLKDLQGLIRNYLIISASNYKLPTSI